MAIKKVAVWKCLECGEHQSSTRENEYGHWIDRDKCKHCNMPRPASHYVEDKVGKPKQLLDYYEEQSRCFDTDDRHRYAVEAMLNDIARKVGLCH